MGGGVGRRMGRRVGEGWVEEWVEGWVEGWVNATTRKRHGHLLKTVVLGREGSQGGQQVEGGQEVVEVGGGVWRGRSNY